jgi:diguanylate cyclase (GGDEF)-like protein
MKTGEQLSDATYIVLVRSLYQTLLPSSIMAVSFLGVGAHVAAETTDLLLLCLTILGAAAALARLVVVIRYRPAAMNEGLDADEARAVERRFAIPYLTFALLFGAFSARALQVSTAESHILVVGLLFGFAAGVASGVFLRPWIALPSVLLAVIPPALVALTTSDLTYIAAGLLLCTFLAGGIERIIWNYRVSSAEITRRHDFSSLARTDDLTGLSNRLSLRESFDACVAQSGKDGLVAVHCLDLDRFKPVNDVYGHPFGDALLRAVSGRLKGVLRRDDIAARVGGDEFVIVQTGIRHPGEADLLARRILRVISEPFSIDGQQVTIGTSVGYSLFPEDSSKLDDLVAQADQALVAVKRDGGGVRRYRATASSHSDRRLYA